MSGLKDRPVISREHFVELLNYVGVVYESGTECNQGSSGPQLLSAISTLNHA